MKEEIKNLWVEALKSGDYKQGRRRLSYVSDGARKYCCLGVLCELAVEAGVVPKPKLNQWFEDDEISGSYAYGTQSEFALPVEVSEWAGMRSDTGEYLEIGREDNLASNNDCGFTFGEISDIIRRNWETL